MVMINVDQVQTWSHRRIYEIMREQINRLERAPGTQLHLEELAERYGVEVATVQEATLKLLSEGIVEEAFKGYRVIQFDQTFISQIYVVRRALELACLRSVSANWDYDALEDLCQTWTAVRSSHELNPLNFEHYLTIDSAFHQRIARMSGNTPMIWSVEKIMWMSTLIWRWHYAENQCHESVATMANEHVVVLDALLARDIDAALVALDGHLMREHNSLIAIFEIRA